MARRLTLPPDASILPDNANVKDSKMKTRPLLLCLLALCAAGALRAKEFEFQFTSSLDRSPQLAVGFVPDGHDGNSPLPLLVEAHYMGGDRNTAKKLGFQAECQRRGWLLVSPELHGDRAPGPFSMAALPAQRDILDAIAHMKANYPVDSSRIYLDGRSMGGMMAMLMAAKHPELFAAVMAGQGVSDLKPFMGQTACAGVRDGVLKELAPYGPDSAFEYARRSAVNYAPNFQYVPFMLWHGTNDTWVPPSQSQALFDAIKRYNPHQAPVSWLVGAPHCADNYTPAWICSQLQYFQNQPEAGMNVPTRFYPKLEFVADEPLDFFWLRVEPVATDKFCRVKASIENGKLTIAAESVKALAVLADKIDKGSPFAKVECVSDVPLTLTLVKDGKVAATATGNKTELKN